MIDIAAAKTPKPAAPPTKTVLVGDASPRAGGAARTPPLVGEPLLDGAIVVGSTLGFAVEPGLGELDALEPLPSPEPLDDGGCDEPDFGFELFFGAGVLDDVPTARAALMRLIPLTLSAVLKIRDCTCVLEYPFASKSAATPAT